MITLSDAAMSALTRSYKLYLSVESWYGDELLAASVPVDGGGEETDRTLRVPETIKLTVPKLYRGESWSPVRADHPLAANGQRLRVQLGIGLAGSTIEWFNRGEFVITDSVPDGDEVSVTAAGLLALVDEAGLVSPYQPTGTLVSTLRGLIEPALTVVVDSALTDRAVPAGINYDEDRLGAVMELLDAWPADAYVTEDGYLSVVPADRATDHVLLLTDAVGGTLLSSTGSSTRDGAANVIVARGTAPDGGQVQGVAYDVTSPKRLGGPFNPLPVPFFFPSPLLTTVAQCQAAAATVLARRQRETGLEFTAKIVPHPALQVGDVVSVNTAEYPQLDCFVEALSLPYTPDGGAQELTLRAVPV